MGLRDPAHGDLGSDFKLVAASTSRGGTFRVIALRYLGPARDGAAGNCLQDGRVLDDPARYGAIVRTVHTLTVRPELVDHVQMVNVDGLKLLARGPVTVSVGVGWLSSPQAGHGVGGLERRCGDAMQTLTDPARALAEEHGERVALSIAAGTARRPLELPSPPGCRRRAGRAT